MFNILKNKKKDAEKLFNEGVIRAQKEDYEGAIIYYNASIDLFDKAETAFLNRGYAYHKLEEFGQAILDYQKAIAIGPNTDTSHYASLNLNSILPIANFKQRMGKNTKQLLEQDGIEKFCKGVSSTSIKNHAQNDLALVNQFIQEELSDLYKKGGKYQSLAETLGFTGKASDSALDTTKMYLFFRSVLYCFNDEKNLQFEIHQKLLEYLINLTSHQANPLDHIHQIKKQVDRELKRLNATPLLILHNGEVLFTSSTLESKPKHWLGGTVFEVMLKIEGKDPFFVYYENDDYYYDITLGAKTITNALNAEEYRKNVSNLLTGFLSCFLIEAFNQDYSRTPISYTHNKANTNVLMYVEKYENWYPIFHSSTESEGTSSYRVDLINKGQAPLTDFIPLNDLSPE